MADDVKETPRGWSSLRAHERMVGQGPQGVSMRDVAPGDWLLFEDGQLVEVEGCTREYSYSGGGGNFGMYGGYPSMGGTLTGKYWRVTLAKPLKSGATVADFHDDGLTYFEAGNRVPHVKRVVKARKDV
jgi:hypothetical protein